MMWRFDRQRRMIDEFRGMTLDDIADRVMDLEDGLEAAIEERDSLQKAIHELEAGL